jgi:hypothetical protein
VSDSPEFDYYKRLTDEVKKKIENQERISPVSAFNGRDYVALADQFRKSSKEAEMRTAIDRTFHGMIVQVRVRISRKEKMGIHSINEKYLLDRFAGDKNSRTVLSGLALRRLRALSNYANKYALRLGKNDLKFLSDDCVRLKTVVERDLLGS